ncbi:uncharacterized protein LOC129948947 [Eupeodes corollae]|uniref:uncharacterized protein LOC129948947 n=1 Tax=Eupeodes corollae TaxID=290404 RepID=UPI002491EEF0|nr:uncharacterized protein LOC129948947 [Eupeodes corollae]
MDGIAIWLLFLIFLPFLLFFWKLLLMAWKSFLMTRKLKNSSETSRQNQLSTVSYSVDTNSNRSNGGANNRRGSDATLKIDLPPTYEEVMKNFVGLRELAETSATVAGAASNGANERTNTFGLVHIESGTLPTSEQRNAVV